MVNQDQKQEPTLSQAALGRLLDLSPAAITKLKLQGMPVHSLEAAQAWRTERQNVAARKPLPVTAVAAAPIEGRRPDRVFPDLAPGDFGDEDFQMARTRREIAEANLAEMREAELQGKLIRVEAIRAAWARRVSAARDALLQIPHRVAPVLAAESDLERIGRVLDDELRQALTELSRGDVQEVRA